MKNPMAKIVLLLCLSMLLSGCGIDPVGQSDPAESQIATDPTVTQPVQTETVDITEPTLPRPYDPAYRKIKEAENPDDVPDDVMIVLSTYFKSHPILVDTYDGRWALGGGEGPDGNVVVDLYCYTSISEDYKIKSLSIRYRNGKIDNTYGEHGVTRAESGVLELPKEVIEDAVYSIDDHAGVSDEIKDEFVYFIQTSNSPEWNEIKDNPDPQWCIEYISPFLDDSEPYPTLFLKIPTEGLVCDYKLSSIYYDGRYVRIGLNSKGMKGPLPWEE